MESEFSRLHIHIIGLGLMGGSLAMALKGKVARLTADDLDEMVIQNALKHGVIAGTHECAQADLIILATPVHLMPSLVAELGHQLKDGACVIDLGSTKSAVCQALDDLPPTVQAVGGHPMCGLAENSFTHALPTLYEGARFVLCETTRTTEQTKQIAENLVAACGAIPLWLDRQRHDFLTAVTSHLPHLLNFALMQMALDLAADNDDLFALAAGGFDGATRLARTHESMITGMFSTNAANLRMLTQRLIDELTQLNQLLDEPDQLQTEIREIVQARREYSTRYGERYIT